MSIFDDIMNKTAGSGERPRPLPEGPYRVEIAKWSSRTVKFNDKETGEPQVVPVLRVDFRPVEALEGVDQDELANTPNWLRKPLNQDFWLRESSMYRLDDFLGITMGLGDLNDMPYAEALDRCIGNECIADVAVRDDEDTGEPRYNNIEKLAPADVDSVR